MDKLFINGPAKLSGNVQISCAKNAYLPIIAGVILCPEEMELVDVPNLRDIRTINKVLETLGVKVTSNGRNFKYDASTLTSYEATYELVKTMRASICVLGPLLSRFKQAKVSLPGGCAIGTRPIDLHLSNLEKMGAEIKIESGFVEAKTSGLKGANITLDFPSVGATENLMMAAVLAEGETIIENAALEPEVTDLGNFLLSMGAKIEDLGRKTIRIEGIKKLHTTSYRAIGDRIEAATYIIAALMTKSHVKVTHFVPHHLEFVLDKLEGMGAKLEVGEDFVEVFPSELSGVHLDTAPYPGFPTDVQAQLLALATQAKGPSIITENIFENRFMHVPELKRLGAHITLKGNNAVVDGGTPLKGAPVMCTDLRASASLILAALCAEGETEVRRVYHLDRGYENLDGKLQALGAQVRRENE
jgi:UDP-N-acetylglucosamine 1-carboxyvinyltransferase